MSPHVSENLCTIHMHLQSANGRLWMPPLLATILNHISSVSFRQCHLVRKTLTFRVVYWTCPTLSFGQRYAKYIRLQYALSGSFRRLLQTSKELVWGISDRNNITRKRDTYIQRLEKDFGVYIILWSRIVMFIFGRRTGFQVVIMAIFLEYWGPQLYPMMPRCLNTKTKVTSLHLACTIVSTRACSSLK